MQREFWSDIGRTSQGGETSTILLPTCSAVRYGSNQGGATGRDGQKNRPSLDTMASSGLISSVADSPASLFQWREIVTGYL